MKKFVEDFGKEFKRLIKTSPGAYALYSTLVDFAGTYPSSTKEKGDCETCERHDSYGCTWVHWVDPECDYVPRSSKESANE